MIKNKKNRGLVVSLKNLICTALSSTAPMTTSDKVTLHKVIVLIDDMLLDKVKVTNTFLKEQSEDDLESLKKMYVQAKCIEFSLVLEGSPHAHV